MKMLDGEVVDEKLVGPVVDEKKPPLLLVVEGRVVDEKGAAEEGLCAGWELAASWPGRAGASSM